MEGSQAPVPVPTPATPKKNTMVIAAVVIVAVIVIAIAAVLLMGGNDDSGDNIGNDLATWEPDVGDYYEYSISTFGMEGNMRTEVISIDGDMMTVRTTSSLGGYEESQEETVPLGETYLSPDEFDPEGVPEGTIVEDKGKQVLNLEVGTVSAQHYKVTVTEETDEYAFDVWLYKGMVVKMTGNFFGIEMTIVMTDTNVF